MRSNASMSCRVHGLSMRVRDIGASELSRGHRRYGQTAQLPDLARAKPSAGIRAGERLTGTYFFFGVRHHPDRRATLT